MNFKIFLSMLSRKNPDVFIGYAPKSEDEEYGEHVYSSVHGFYLNMPTDFYFDGANIINRRKNSPIQKVRVDDLYLETTISYVQLVAKLSELNRNSEITYDELTNSIVSDIPINKIRLPKGFMKVEDENKLTDLYAEYNYTYTKAKKVVASKPVYNNSGRRIK